VRERALNMADEDERMHLSPDLLNRLDRDQIERLRSARSRASWEDRRSTTHPAELTLVAVGTGSVRERRPLAAAVPSRGALEAPLPNVRGGLPGMEATRDEDAEGPRAGGDRDGRAARRQEPDCAKLVPASITGRALPSVARGRQSRAVPWPCSRRCQPCLETTRTPNKKSRPRFGQSFTPAPPEVCREPGMGGAASAAIRAPGGERRRAFAPTSWACPTARSTTTSARTLGSSPIFAEFTRRSIPSGPTHFRRARSSISGKAPSSSSSRYLPMGMPTFTGPRSARAESQNSIATVPRRFAPPRHSRPSRRPSGRACGFEPHSWRPIRS